MVGVFAKVLFHSPFDHIGQLRQIQEILIKIRFIEFLKDMWLLHSILFHIHVDVPVTILASELGEAAGWFLADVQLREIDDVAVLRALDFHIFR